MSGLRKYGAIVVAGLAGVLLTALPAQTSRDEFAITGYVSRKSMQPPYQPIPVSGAFNARISFYASQDGADVLASEQREVSLDKGALNILIKMPDNLLEQNEVWYGLQIDLDANGLDNGDWFGERGRFSASPYSISTRVTKYFQTNGGQGASNAAGAGSGRWPAQQMAVCPFITPAGGILFDRMAIDTDVYTETVRFGLYDAEGKRVVQASTADAAEVLGKRRIYPVPQTYLQPTRVYFTAYSTTGATGPALGTVMIPPIRYAGYVYTGNEDATLPDVFSPSTIYYGPETYYRPMNIALYLDEVFSGLDEPGAPRVSPPNVENGALPFPEELPP